MDTAKAVAVGLASSADEMGEVFRGRAPLKVALGVGAVVTMAASGSETSPTAVLSDGKTHEKLICTSPLLQTFNDFHMHNSTHADSPSHVIPESPYTHELPLENYYGPAVCLDIPKKHWELITVEDIENAAAKVEGGIQEGDWVIICTGMNKRWGENDDYFAYSPGLSIEGAHWFVDHKVKGVGFDLQALDHILYTYTAEHGPGRYVPRIVEQYIKEFGHSPLEDFPEWEPVHEILLGNNVMGIENIGGDVEKVKGQRFTFCAFPLRWYMGDGTIVRAVAVIDEDKINKDVPDRVYKYGVY